MFATGFTSAAPPSGWSSFESSSSSYSSVGDGVGDIIKRGYIRLQIPEEYSCSCFRANGGWKRKYLLVRDGALFIFASAEAVTPVQCVSLYGAACILIQFPKCSEQIAVEVITPQHNLYLVAASPDRSAPASELSKETRQWALTLQRASVLASGGVVPAHFLAPAASSRIKPSSRTPSPAASPEPSRKSFHSPATAADDYKSFSYQDSTEDDSSSMSQSQTVTAPRTGTKAAYAASSRANGSSAGHGSSNDPNEPLLQKQALFS